MGSKSLILCLFGFALCISDGVESIDNTPVKSNNTNLAWSESIENTIPNALNNQTQIKPVAEDTLSPEKWQKYQDSIRKVILKNKENAVLKNSILQEAYIKNIVSLKNDTLYVLIPFDLHGFDWGAPDCYSTDIAFKFKFAGKVDFPKQLPFTLREHGCISKELNLSGVFELIESDPNFITYHSRKNKSTLIIFKSDERHEFIYYFVGVSPQTVKGRQVHKIIDAYDEENPKSKAPYRSTIMKWNDYEFLLNSLN